MRLLRCHIENFGTLSDLDLDFSENLHVLKQENGWGKTTLAAFIKAMFYGLEGEKKRNLSENERQRFMPWNTRSFSGELTFETNGKQYTIIRDFGKKEKDATFRLLDATTGLDSRCFSQNIGEELFAVDSESFRKTAFIAHQDIHYSGAGSTIGAKAAAIDCEGDLENFDKAQKALTDFLNASSARRSTGSISKMNNRISELEQKVAQEAAVGSRIEQLRTGREKEIERKTDLDRTYKALSGEKADRAAKETEKLRQKRLSELSDEIEKRQKELETNRQLFGDTLPEKEELDSLQDRINRLQKTESEYRSIIDGFDNEKFSILASLFGDDVPTQEEIRQKIDQVNELQNLSQQNSFLKQEQIKLDERAAKEKEAQFAATQKSQKSKRALTILSPVCFLCAVICFAVYFFAYHSVVVLGIGIVMAAAAGMCLMLMKTTSVNPGNESAQEESDYQSRVSQNQTRIDNIKREMESFLGRWGLSSSPDEDEAILYDLKAKAEDYRQICEIKAQKEGEADQVRKTIENEKQELIECAKAQRILSEEESIADPAILSARIAEKKELLIRFELEQGALEEANKKLAEFLSENPDLEQNGSGEVSVSETDSFAKETRKDNDTAQKISETLTEEEIAFKLSKTEKELSEVTDLISRYDRQLEDAYEQLDEIAAEKELLLNLKEDKKTLAAKVKLYEKTGDYLKQAKDSLIARYMSPIKDAFDRYYMMMSGETAGEFRIDADLNLTRREEGLYRDVSTQSDGYGDMIGLCIRLALLDVMYEQEKPVLIMDDPFSNLDEKHLAGAKAFLQKASEQYQIIYLTCHGSRA